MEQQLLCPKCHKTGLHALDEVFMACTTCRNVWERSACLCPTCQMEVGASEEVCRNCAEPLNILGQVISRHTHPSEARWLEQMRMRAAELKQSEMRASQARMEGFWQIEHRRLQAIAEEEAARRKADRKLILVVGIAIPAITALVILTGLFLILRA